MVNFILCEQKVARDVDSHVVTVDVNMKGKI